MLPFFDGTMVNPVAGGLLMLLSVLAADCWLVADSVDAVVGVVVFVTAVVGRVAGLVVMGACGSISGASGSGLIVPGVSDIGGVMLGPSSTLLGWVADAVVLEDVVLVVVVVAAGAGVLGEVFVDCGLVVGHMIGCCLLESPFFPKERDIVIGSLLGLATAVRSKAGGGPPESESPPSSLCSSSSSLSPPDSSELSVWYSVLASFLGFTLTGFGT